MLAKNELFVSSKLAAALQTKSLGALAERANLDCLGKACEGTEKKLENLFETARPLSDDEILAPAGFRVEIGATAPPAEARPKAFLDGRADWLTLRCIATSRSRATPAAPTATAPLVDQPKLVVAKSEDDAGKVMVKREFASFGYSSDRLTDKSTYDMDLFVGYAIPLMSAKAPLYFQPFLSAQRHSEEDVDDMAVGFALTRYFYRSRIRLKPAWESDHRLDSSVWRIDLGWTPRLFPECEAISIPGKQYASCDITLVADYADIRDAGNKADLAKLPSYSRIGLDLDLVYGRSLGEDAGFLILSGGYKTRGDYSGHGGDADLMTASIGYAPGAPDHFKVSIDYTNGRDLTSLKKQERVALTVGFRR